MTTSMHRQDDGFVRHHRRRLPRSAIRIVHGDTVTAMTRDAYNRVSYGPEAPRYAERIWVDPRACRTYLERPQFYRVHSGRVETGPWPTVDERPVEQHPAVRASLRRWGDGQPWEDTGEVERMLALLAAGNVSDGLFDEEQIRRRCGELDQLFELVRAERRLRTRQELDPTTRREIDGIGVHLAPDGRPVKAGGGFHRFAMALALGLPVIPAQLGVVHLDAIERLRPLRSTP